MAKVNFTVGRVKGHSCPAGKPQAFLWDSSASGLGLRATAAGSLSYIFQGKLNGATVRVTIGSPKDWGIDDARDEARRLQRLIDAGKDPREEAADQRAALAARKAEAERLDVTFADAWSAYLVELEAKPSPKTKRRRSAQYIEDHRKLAAPGGAKKKRGKGLTSQGPLHALMPIKLSDMTGDAIAAWMEGEVTERPTSVAYAYRIFKAFAGWCEGQTRFQGLLPNDCYSSPKVTALLPSVKTPEGDCLEREQLPAWFKAVRALPNPVAAAYLQGLLITGPRREELAELRWQNVDLLWNKIKLRDKVEGSRTIPLTPYFRSLLVELKRINDTPPSAKQLQRMADAGKPWQPSPWVFPSDASESGHIEEPRFAHDSAIRDAGLPHLTLQGLRRSFGTLAEWVDVPAGVVAQIQGHKPSALAEKHYRRRHIDLLRDWHIRIEAWMLERAGIDFKPEQVQQDSLVPQ
ncbi:integrase family protein [Burkholderia vietnamiensis]|uniref:tyrosine-type recombinase/integrase n=1 Tax=Burkholderia vietnamiensis TaxID=60552 RepID=UPI001B949B10|nr:integrase family protein [Burkholderia vietnamiensis]MBR7918801.1 integrase family protein [Burkholderia vietnamiensis]CAG9228522.1 CP4-6 prophage; putative phage integrase [Burkholderia vietnamiensis]